jgi:hypothetical protein
MCIGNRLQESGFRHQEKTGVTTSEAGSLKSEAEFITGPLVADAGKLCVFRLNDPNARADWVIVPEAECYVDSSGSSFAFASNISARYTIIAAVTVDGVPKILTHVCEYGAAPTPQPQPSPTPKPAPSPNQSLKDWVTQNVPDAGKQDSAALASCYESAASDIESGAILSQEAAFSAIRMATMTKIDIEIWKKFLDELAVKIEEKLAGNKDVKELGNLFQEIAAGLNERPETGDGRPEEENNFRRNINQRLEPESLRSPASSL